MKPNNSRLYLFFLAACVPAYLGCGDAQAKQQPKTAKSQKTPAAKQAPSATAARVETARLHPSTARLSTTIPGEVDSSRDAVLASAQGGPVERLLVTEGDRVKKGQLLVQIDTALYSIRKRQAQTRRATAQRAVDRASGLGKVLPEAEKDRRQSAVDAATIDVELASLQLRRSRIVAPFSGIVSEVHTEVGEVVAATAPLLRLVNLDPVEVVLSIPDRDIVAVEKGSRVNVTIAALPDAFTGEVAYVSPTGNRDTRAFEARVAVPNPNSVLRPGMIAAVDVERTLVEGAVVIPQDWLVTRRKGVGVFIHEDGKARFVPVTPGQIMRDQVVISSGLQSGVELVIKGHRTLADGDALSIARSGNCCTNGRVQFD